MNNINVSLVAIVDDEQGEAEPLINTMIKNGIYPQYYNGDPQKMPDEPQGGIRILFLDLWLGPGSENSKTRKSKFAAILSRLIGNDNGPYLIVAWTMHDEDINDLKELFEGNTNNFSAPMACVPLSKEDVKKDGNYDLSKIDEAIKKTIEDHQALEFIMMWERLSLIGVKRTTAFMTSKLVKDEEELKCLVRKLAESSIGEDIADENLALRNSVFELNKLLLDELDKVASEQEFHLQSLLDKCNEGKDINFEIRRNLNQKLNIRFEKSGNVPGAVYEVNDQDIPLINGDLPEDHFESRKSDQNLKEKKILVDVSPWCDYAQNKLRLRRFLPGYLFTSNDRSMPKFLNQGKTLPIYLSPMFEYNSLTAWFSLNIGFLISSEKNLPDKLGEPIFTIRETMLSEIQQKIAHHQERIAVSSFSIPKKI